VRFGVISPQDWGLPVASLAGATCLEKLGTTVADLEQRIHGCLQHWMPRHFDQDEGAFYGFYSAPEKRLEPPQTVNLIAPWLLLAAYDRSQEAALLQMARRSADWFYDRFVVSHPMSVVIGGVRESLPAGDLWTKFAAEYSLLASGIYRRTGDETALSRARQSAGFLIQSARHHFAPRYDTLAGEWRARGWQSFGRVVEAFLELADVTGETRWQARALDWGEFGLTLQAEDGCFYLIDDDYFNTDIAADELRALTFLYEQTRQPRFLEAAERFAAWLLAHQRDDGAWPLTIDRDGNIVVATVGPGDMPNIAVALLRLHSVTGQARYLDAAQLALRYSLAVQILPGGAHPYSDDPNVVWGFWSWDPYYDYTVSGDQATHHIRGFLFLLDYLGVKGV